MPVETRDTYIEVTLSSGKIVRGVGTQDSVDPILSVMGTKQTVHVVFAGPNDRSSLFAGRFIESVEWQNADDDHRAVPRILDVLHEDD